jgi:hypothetical protein
MANVQLAVAGDDNTQVILSVPGVQGPAGSNLPPSGTTNQVLYKQSNTDYDTAWSFVTSAMIASGTIVNEDVNASAAIAGTKISPDFGSQNVVTTGTSTAASFIPTSSSVPTNGVYLPSANNVAISTNGTGQLFVNSAGQVGIGTSGAQNKPLHIYSGANDSEIRLQTNSGTEQNAYLTLRNSGGNLDFYSVNGDIVLNPGNTPAAYFKASGGLGLGTSSPAFALDISAPSDTIVRSRTNGNTSAGFIGSTNNGTNNWFIGSRKDSTGGTSGTDRFNLLYDTNAFLTVSTAGSVGIGTTEPSNSLEVAFSAANSISGITITNGQWFGYGARLQFRNLLTSAGTVGETASIYGEGDGSNAGRLVFHTTAGGTASERARIDSSGRLLVGTSTTRSNVYGSFSPYLQLEGGSVNGQDMLLITRNQNDIFGPQLILAKSRGTANTIVASGDLLGTVSMVGNDGSSFIQAARIEAFVDGTPGSNDMPGRLVFSTTADGASSPTERMRITNGGFIKTSDTGTYAGATGLYHELRSSLNDTTVSVTNTNSSFTGVLLAQGSDTAATASYSFQQMYSSYSGTFDVEFNLRGDGTALADGTWTGGGADYAEFFEWSDGNLEEEDRRGISVVLDGEKIRPALAGEDPIGVISGNPSVVGDAAWNKWSGKYLRDAYGTYILEDYEVVNDEGETVVQQRRKLNPAYDPEAEYIPREQRPEWDCVGLMGKLRIRKGQPTGSRWIKMRDISDSVDEWLVR